ncbi:hypothetical protein BH20ACT23_BH20ACT23_05260 [soil metagenome]
MLLRRKLLSRGQPAAWDRRFLCARCCAALLRGHADLGAGERQCPRGGQPQRTGARRGLRHPRGYVTEDGEVVVKVFADE